MYSLNIFIAKGNQIDVEQKLKKDIGILISIAADYAKANNLSGKDGFYEGVSSSPRNRGAAIRTEIVWLGM